MERLMAKLVHEATHAGRQHTRGPASVEQVGMEGDTVAAEVMDPLPARLALHHSSAAARELMWAAGYSFLVVVAPATGKLLGVVLRRALERGCRPRGHDPEMCPLVRHIETDVDFCLGGERVAEVFGGRPTAIATTRTGRPSPEARRRNAIPVIVVDEDKVPIGLLRRPKATSSPPVASARPG
jgi:CBS domain-containing protein